MLALALRILSFSRLHQTIGANRETCNFLEGSAAGPYQVPRRALAAAKTIGGGAAWAETRPLFKDPCTLTPAPGFEQPLHGHSGSSLISFNDIGYWYWFDTKWRGEEEAIRAQPERGPSWLASQSNVTTPYFLISGRRAGFPSYIDVRVRCVCVLCLCFLRKSEHLPFPAGYWSCASCLLALS